MEATREQVERLRSRPKPSLQPPPSIEDAVRSHPDLFEVARMVEERQGRWEALWPLDLPNR